MSHFPGGPIFGESRVFITLAKAKSLKERLGAIADAWAPDGNRVDGTKGRRLSVGNRRDGPFLSFGCCKMLICVFRCFGDFEFLKT